MGICNANNTLTALMDNDEVDCEFWLCDECGCKDDPEGNADRDGLCPTCYNDCHFECEECTETFHLDDQSEEFKGLCNDCGCSKHQELAGDLWSKIEELAGSWDGEDREIANLKKLLGYARKLRKE